MGYDDAEQRSAIRYEDLELIVPEEHRPRPRGGVAVWIIWSALAVIAGILIAALLLATPPSQPDVTSTARTATGVPLGSTALPPAMATESSRSRSVDRVTGPGGASLTVVAALVGGTATWCAPTPTHCQSWGGRALKAAVESFTYGDDPYLVRVCRDGTNRCVTVTVVSYCACGITLIDLSPYAFRQLAPLSRGRIRVTVDDIVGLPATDTR
jgi:hypothetical protein